MEQDSTTNDETNEPSNFHMDLISEQERTYITNAKFVTLVSFLIQTTVIFWFNSQNPHAIIIPRNSAYNYWFMLNIAYKKKKDDHSLKQHSMG